MDLFTGKCLWLPDMLADGFRRGGDKIFTIYQRADGNREEASYAAIETDAIELLERLKKAGLKKGDRLAVVSAMRPRWFSVLYAALLGGYRMVCIDPGVPQNQIHSMIRQTEVRAVFTSASSLSLPSKLNGRIPMYFIDKGFPLLNGCESVDLLLENASEMPEDTFFILFSSGTTGETRKGVLLPHSSLAIAFEYGLSTTAGIYKNTAAYNIGKRDLLLFPPYHIAGLLCAVYEIYFNTEVIILEKLTPNELAAAIQELKPDNICTVPSMLSLLMKKMLAGLGEKRLAKPVVLHMLRLSGFLRRYLGINIGLKLFGFLNRRALGGNLKSFIIGGSSCDADTMRFFLNMGIDVYLTYGLTELGAPLAVTGKGYYPGTTGRVLRHTDKMDIRIAKPDENGMGEVEILSPFRMISYLREEDMQDCFTEDGYFRSGDLGYFDKRDCLVICGRAKESIVMRNGEKLLPEEIEALYQNIVNVSELSVFKVPDGDFDAFSIAAIRQKSSGIPEEASRRYILDRAASLPAMYRPQEVYMLNELPLSSTRKVQRFRLTDMVLRGETSPVTEASFRRIDEDCVTAELRKLLTEVSGVHWKRAELTEGLPLELDSLQTIDLFIAIQEHFGKDFFRLASPPETFGALLEAVNNYEQAEKNDRLELDLSEFPKPVKKSEKVFYTGMEKLMKLIYNVHGKGMENLPEDDNYLICSNHVTALDPGVICACLPRAVTDKTAIVGKAELVEDRFLKDFVRSHNLIPIDRVGNSLATLDRCRELIEEGWNVLIFPEGTNYDSAKVMLHFREGPARLSLATGKSIVPVHISGFKEMDKENPTFLPPLGGRVIANFGKPISPKGYDPSGLNAALRSAIEALEPEGYRD